MKYPKGTFWKNLEAAKKFGDDEMVMDLVADQTTDIALAHPDALNAAIEHAGIKVDKANHDAKYLIGLVADNIHSNPKLVQNLSLMISDLNTPNKAEGSNFMNGEGDADSTAAAPAPSSGGGGGGGAGGIIGGVGSILGAVSGLAGTITTAVTGGKIEKEKNKGKMFDYLSAKENAKAMVAKEAAAAKAAVASNKTMLTIGLAVVIVGGLGFALYTMNKNAGAVAPPSLVPVVQ